MNKTLNTGKWRFLIVLLLILSLALVACGGGGDDDDGSDADTQTQDDTGQGDFSTIPEDVVDKGEIEFEQGIDDEITSEDESHSYSFEGVSGDSVVIGITAGAGGITGGSAFTSPYAFLYSPDGALLANSDTEDTGRSSSFNYTLEENGTYTIVVQPVEGVGVEPYEVVLEHEVEE